MGTLSTTIATKKLGNVGAEVLGVEAEQLLEDDELPAACMAALAENGVLVFRELHIDDETQVAFSKKLDDVGKARAGRAATHLQGDARPDQDRHRGAVCWGRSTGTSTVRRTRFRPRPRCCSAHVISSDGRRDGVRQYVRGLRGAQRRGAGAARGSPGPPYVRGVPAAGASRSHARRPRALAPEAGQGAPARVAAPLGPALPGDRRHGRPRRRDGPRPRGGRCSSDLLGRATTTDRLYRHEWTVGDLVIWDNTGVMHRVQPYEASSAREMHRTTMSGDEPIR